MVVGGRHARELGEQRGAIEAWPRAFEEAHRRACGDPSRLLVHRRDQHAVERMSEEREQISALMIPEPSADSIQAASSAVEGAGKSVRATCGAGRCDGSEPRYSTRARGASPRSLSGSGAIP